MDPENVQPALTSPKCYLETDDPRASEVKYCYLDYFYHAGTFTFTLTHLNGQVVEKVHVSGFEKHDSLSLQQVVTCWHNRRNYLIPTPTSWSGKKIPSTRAKVIPKVDPPWVAKPDLFGSWRPSLLKHEDYHLIEVMIDGEKCFACWRNLSQKCHLKYDGQLGNGFHLVRDDGSFRLLGRPLGLETIKHDGKPRVISAFCHINPPGVAPEGPSCTKLHDINEHLSHRRANMRESELSVNYRATAFQDKNPKNTKFLDEEGYPLVKGYINGLEVFVERESYWKECYLSMSIGDICKITLQRTNGKKEIVRFKINDNVSSALQEMVEVWRGLWPDEIPGFVRDVSADRAAHERKNAQEHWFNETYGFGDHRAGRGSRVYESLLDGSVATVADVMVREVSDGFGLKLIFGDGSAEVIHFNTADLMHGRKEISEVIEIWKTFQGEARGTVQTGPEYSEGRNDSSWESFADASYTFLESCLKTLGKKIPENSRAPSALRREMTWT